MDASIVSSFIATGLISPRVIKSSLFLQGMDFPAGHKLEKRFVYDYELELIVESCGSMEIDNKIYNIKKGDIVFRKPGQQTQGIMPYCCYLICFDMRGDLRKDADNYDFHKPQEFQHYYINPVLEAVPTVLSPVSSEKYTRLFDHVLKEFINHSQISDLLLKSYMLQILYHLYMDVNNFITRSTYPYSSHNKSIDLVIEHIHGNIEQKLTLNALSKIANLSPSHFHKVFTASMGVSPIEYITKKRLEKSKELLVKTNFSIAEIALSCGFENIPYFSYVFKKKVKLTPGEFRKKFCYM